MSYFDINSLNPHERDLAICQQYRDAAEEGRNRAFKVMFDKPDYKRDFYFRHHAYKESFETTCEQIRRIRVLNY